MNNVQPPDLIAAIDMLYNAHSLCSLNTAIHHIILALFRLLRMYCSSALTDFSISENTAEITDFENDLTTGKIDFEDNKKIKDVAECMDKLLFSVETLHNVPNIWKNKYQAFFVEAHLMYGLKSYGKVTSSLRTIQSKYHFDYVTFQHWVGIKYNSILVYL